jgi:LysM repeat protein
MERLTIKRGDTLSGVAKRIGVPLHDLIRANPSVKDPDVIHPGQQINIPVKARHAPSSADGKPLGDVIGKDAVNVGGEPAADPKYVQNSTVAVGIPIWGGAFALYQNVANGRGVDPVMLQRTEVSLAQDPLKPPVGELRAVYKDRVAADSAVAEWQGRLSYTYYVGPGGLIYPTVISDTTAPGLCDALRKAVEQERKDAAAAEKLAIQLLFWYVGARLPVKTSAGSTGSGTSKGVAAAAAQESALAAFTPVEQTIIREVQQIMTSPQMIQIRQAAVAGKDITVKVGNRVIQYEPGLKASGMTMFGENGFLIGREAFASEAELTKTVLHETYRLTTSAIGKGAAVTKTGVTAETNAAFEFAERAYQAMVGMPK